MSINLSLSRALHIAKQTNKIFSLKFMIWVSLIMACLVSFKLFNIVAVSTLSMQYTINPGDHLVIDRVAFTASKLGSRNKSDREGPYAGDIVMFRSPTDASELFIKRVVGIPGDHLKMIGRVLYRNGNRIAEPYTRPVSLTESSDPSRDNFPIDLTSLAEIPHNPLLDNLLRNHVVNGEIVVPSDCFFVMGDNRDDSYDSRYWGFVPRENILGKPVLIYWSSEWNRLLHVFRPICREQSAISRICFVQ